MAQVKRWQPYHVPFILIATARAALEDNPGLALEHPGPGGISEQLRVHEVEDADDEREEEEEEEEASSVGSFSGENI